MERMPSMLNDFSKETNQEGRDNLAHEIREQRRERDEANRLRDSIDRAEQEIGNRMDNFWKKIIYYQQNKQDQSSLEQTKQELSQIESSADKTDPWAKVADFQKRERERFVSAETDHSEINQLFSAENLANISTEDYRLLLQKYPGRLATHVTGFGARDHFGMSEHTAGLGKFDDGFIKMLESGKLVSVLDERLASEELSIVASEFFETHIVPYLEQAQNYPNSLTEEQKEMSQSQLAQYYVDRAFVHSGFRTDMMSDYLSVHFGSEYVMDEFYGGESGNEVFTVVPEYTLAIQGKVLPSSDISLNKQNDLYYLSDGRAEGIDLDSTLVFLPEGTPVDRNTGSKYEVNEEGRAVVDEDFLREMIGFISGPSCLAVVNKLNELKRAEIDNLFWDELDESIRQQIPENIFYAIRESRGVENIVGHFSRERSIGVRPEEELINDLAREILLKSKMLYKRSADQIVSKDYWESYLNQHPELRPKHIVYYSRDPNSSLRDWIRQGYLDPRAMRKDIKQIDDISPQKIVQQAEIREMHKGRGEIKADFKAALSDEAYKRYGVLETAKEPSAV